MIQSNAGTIISVFIIINIGYSKDARGYELLNTWDMIYSMLCSSRISNRLFKAHHRAHRADGVCPQAFAFIRGSELLSKLLLHLNFG
jgi:hypothetical protein